MLTLLLDGRRAAALAVIRAKMVVAADGRAHLVDVMTIRPNVSHGSLVGDGSLGSFNYSDAFHFEFKLHISPVYF